VEDHPRDATNEGSTFRRELFGRGELECLCPTLEPVVDLLVARGGVGALEDGELFRRGNDYQGVDEGLGADVRIAEAFLSKVDSKNYVLMKKWGIQKHTVSI
jgi:hypothetical protein